MVVRRDPDVVAPRPDANGCSVGSIRQLVGPVAEQLGHLVRERFLTVRREVSLEERGVHLPLPQLGDQLHELRLELVEQRPHLGGRRLRLVVVEEHVVPLGGPVSDAVDVLELQLDDPLERRQEGGEVGLPLRLHPDRARLGGGAGHLRPQRRRDVHRLLVVAAHEGEQRGVVGIRIERLLQRA